MDGIILGPSGNIFVICHVTTKINDIAIINLLCEEENVLFHDDEKGHLILGEAVVSLALGDREISIDTLIAELNQMAEEETRDSRLAEICDARHWLKQFRLSQVRSDSGLRWLMAASQDESGKPHENVIRLRPEEDEDR